MPMGILHVLARAACDKGLISSTPVSSEFRRIEGLVGEYADVYCVAHKRKPLAALDSYKRRGGAVRKAAAVVLRDAKDRGVKRIRIPRKSALNYLNTIYFLPKHERRALALCRVLHTTDHPVGPKSMDAVIGILLGYNSKNILHYYSRNHPDDALTMPMLKTLRRRVSRFVCSMKPGQFPVEDVM